MNQREGVTDRIDDSFPRRLAAVDVDIGRRRLDQATTELRGRIRDWLVDGAASRTLAPRGSAPSRRGRRGAFAPAPHSRSRRQP